MAVWTVVSPTSRKSIHKYGRWEIMYFLSWANYSRPHFPAHSSLNSLILCPNEQPCVLHRADPVHSIVDSLWTRMRDKPNRPRVWDTHMLSLFMERLESKRPLVLKVDILASLPVHSGVWHLYLTQHLTVTFCWAFSNSTVSIWDS